MQIHADPDPQPSSLLLKEMSKKRFLRYHWRKSFKSKKIKVAHFAGSRNRIHAGQTMNGDPDWGTKGMLNLIGNKWGRPFLSFLLVRS